MILRICKLIVFSTFLLITCGPNDPEESCSPIDAPDATRYIQITYPAAGDTISLSNPAAVQFKFQKVAQISEMKIGATLTINKNYYELTGNEALSVSYKGEFTCAEIPWTINGERLSLSENDVVTAKLKVYNYQLQSDIYYETGTFYIRK
jgi:hypothetical protein